MCTIFFSDVTSFVAALLFAVHPIHIEAVSSFKIYNLWIEFNLIFTVRYCSLFLFITHSISLSLSSTRSAGPLFVYRSPY